jgi:polyphosphate kinase
MKKKEHPGLKNLVPLNKRTKEEQRKIVKMGGYESGRVRKRQKETREIIEAMLKKRVRIEDIRVKKVEDIKKAFPNLFSEEMTINEILTIVQTYKGAFGDLAAIENMRNRVDGMPGQNINLKVAPGEFKEDIDKIDKLIEENDVKIS